ncbi:MAG: molybdopterin-guanine dinucleotide biosynthesis protein B [Candidatus Methanomethylicota archaeon]|uniref:Molybdopterin-guanine dinucleotide biosynthesis protein B n=1 Tax=Thermoproteota archaeon TaxID=2056631 RepID=A0A497EVQ0_9CREN|nr:MAG: molybdopterin-guanine dinucleotide biosynthesis protein B [Candidatus Verstraetearchaeota archaeon]
MRIFCITAVERRVGKTKLIENLIMEFKRRNIRVSTIKHVSDEIDLKGKDTYRHIIAGAEVTLAISPSKSVLFTSEINLERLIELYMPKGGLILIEGFRKSSYPKILIVKDINDLKSCGVRGEIKAIVCSSTELLEKVRELVNVPVFHFDDVKRIADFIFDEAVKSTFEGLPKINCRLCGYKGCMDYARAIVMGRDVEGKCAMKRRVKVYIDNSELGIKPFIEHSLSKIIEGYLSSLKGFKSNFRRIIIEIESD